MISTGNLKTAFFKFQNLPSPPKPPKVLQCFTHQNLYISHVAFEILGTLKSPQSTVYPSLQGREAIVVPGVHLGPRRQQHPADLRVAGVRRPVQRGAAVDVRRGHRAGHRPQQVPDPAEVTVEARRDDVVAASEGHGPPREGTGGRAAEAKTETQNSLQELS